MNGESTRIVFPTSKERGVIVYSNSNFLWWEKEKEEERHTILQRGKWSFFLLYPVLISFLVSLLVFSKLGNFVAMKDCWWEGWAVIPQRYPPVVPGSVSLSELSVGGVCEYVNSGISSSDVLQWEIFLLGDWTRE